MMVLAFVCFMLATLVFFLLGLVTRSMALRVSVSIFVFVALSGIGLYYTFVVVRDL